MPIYIVSGFQQGTFRTYETKKTSINEAIAHAESIGMDPEMIKCPSRHEVYRKQGKDWALDSYQPPKKISEPGEHNVLYLVSFFVPPVGLIWGGIRAACGMNGGLGAVVAAVIGGVLYGVGYVVWSSMR
ncbi:MAG: hypothetical protein R3B68_13040 [Phycisphaerales bacterium]